MTVAFNYTHSIAGGTPMIAAEVQDNFTELLAWIEDYYQQKIETTQEIDAAIAALGTNVVNVVAEDSAVVSGASFLGNGGDGTNNAVAGLSATWTASSNRAYEITVYGLGMTFTSSTAGRSLKALINYRINGAGSYFNIAQTSAEVVVGRPTTWLPGGASALVVGQSGSITAQVFTNIGASDGLAPNPTYTYVSGTARLVVRDLGVATNQGV